MLLFFGDFPKFQYILSSVDIEDISGLEQALSKENYRAYIFIETKRGRNPSESFVQLYTKQRVGHPIKNGCL